MSQSERTSRSLSARFRDFVRTRLRLVTFSGITISSLLLILFLALWIVRREPIPKVVTVSTATAGQSYHVFGTDFCEKLNERINPKEADVVESDGSPVNIQRLIDGTASLALAQGGTLVEEGCSVVAPLYPEVVHVLISTNLLESLGYDEAATPNARVLRKLAQPDRPLQVFAGAANSGMRKSAEEILIQHYGIGPIEFVLNPRAEVVLSTTGIFSKAMVQRLEAANYQFLALDAASLSARYAHFVEETLPEGVYGYPGGRPMPARPVATVSTTAYLLTSPEAPPELVLQSLSALYDSDLSTRHPDLISRYDAKQHLGGVQLHRTSQDYFYPFDVGATAALVEAIAGTKELLFAFGAGIYLLWSLRRRKKDQILEEQLQASRQELNRFVDETLEIEKAQMDVNDPAQLQKFLDDVTLIKLKALDELTDDTVRGDRMFSIFLLQCANLINKLQLKIMHVEQQPADPFARPQDELT